MATETVNRVVTLTTQLKGLDDIQRAAAAMNKASTEAKSLGANLNNLGKSNISGALQNNIRNASFQLQDFFVQVNSGQDSVRALSQQLPQLLVGFGAVGAAIGVAASLLPNIISIFTNTSEKAVPLKDAISGVESAFSKLEQSADQFSLVKLIDQFNKAGKEARAATIDMMRFNLAVAGREVSDLEKSIADVTNNLKDFTGVFSSSAADQINRFFDIKKLQQNAGDYALFLKFQKEVMAGQLDVATSFAKYGPLFAKYSEEGASFGKSLGLLADKRKQLAEATDLLNKMEAAGADAKLKGGTEEKAKKLRKEIKELEDYNAIISAQREIYQDLTDPIKKVTAAQEQLNQLQNAEVIQNLTAMGVSFEAIKKYTTELAAQLKKTRGEWTLLDEVTARGLAAQEKFDQYVSTVSQMSVELEAGRMSAEVFWTQLQKLQEFNPIAAVEGLKKLKEPLDEMGVAIGTTIADGLGGLVDVLVESQKSFREWAVDVLKQLAKVIIKLAVVGAMKRALGGTSLGDFFGISANAKGNPFAKGTTLPTNTILRVPTLFQFASGGVFGTRLGVGGEAGPEAVVPLKRTSAGNLGVEASPVNITVKNNFANEANVSVESTNQPDGTRTIEIMIDRRVKAALSNGSMDSVMRNNYGVRRAAMG